MLNIHFNTNNTSTANALPLTKERIEIYVAQAGTSKPERYRSVINSVGWGRLDNERAENPCHGGASVTYYPETINIEHIHVEIEIDTPNLLAFMLGWEPIETSSDKRSKNIQLGHVMGSQPEYRALFLQQVGAPEPTGWYFPKVSIARSEPIRGEEHPHLYSVSFHVFYVDIPQEVVGTVSYAPETAPDLANRPPKEPPRSKMLRALIARDGLLCQGCGLRPQDLGFPEWKLKGLIEIDHKMPRTDGGGDELANRVLLCGKCNKTKSNKMTLSGLQTHNRKHGLMVGKVSTDRTKPRRQQAAAL